MGQLHEILAVEGDLETTYQKILIETGVQFTKHSDRFFGKYSRIEMFDELAPVEADDHQELDDTVMSKIGYTTEHIVNYFDAVYQKDKANQVAVADIVIDNNVVVKDVPVTFLLGLESKLKHVRKSIYDTIPTLQPGVKWEAADNVKEGAYKKVYADEKFRTKKVMKNHVIAEATDRHPAQVQTYNEDEKIGKVVTDTWCGMISPHEKSVLLARLDKMLRAVKQARQQANSIEVGNETIGEALFSYING